jgi:hypothetical protein
MIDDLLSINHRAKLTANTANRFSVVHVKRKLLAYQLIY